MRKYLFPGSILLIAATALAASTFTTHYNLEKPKDGSTSWGSAIRDNMDKIDTQMNISASGLANHLASSTAHEAGKIVTTPGSSLCILAQTAQDYLDCLDSNIGPVLVGGSVNLSGTQTISGLKTFSSLLTGTGGFNFTGTKQFGDFTSGLLHANVSGVLSSSLLLNVDVDPAAGIDYSKLNLAGSIVNADIASGAAIDDSKLATLTTSGKVANSATTAVSTNTPSAIVARDASGNFSAGTISSALVGNVTGNLTGNVTGNVSGSAASFTGNLSGDVTSVGMVTSISNLADSKLATISTAGKVSNSATTATSANTPSAIVARDASGNFTAGTITAASFVGDLNGTASSATTALSANTATSATTATNFSGSLSGDVTGTQGATVISNLADSKLAQITSSGKVANSATTATSTNTASAIVARDASGNFTAGTITAALSGNATTATSFTGSLSGDVSGTQSAVTVNKIKGVTVDDAAKANGRVLSYNSTSGNIEYAALAGSGDVSSNTATSVDSEVALFSGTGGKTIKRASASGVAVLSSGVLSALSPSTSGGSIIANGTAWSSSSAWRVDANITGANPSLGASSVSSYTGIEDVSLVLTNNTGNGVLTAMIPCSGTTAPSGTTCSAGNESVGVSFTIPDAVSDVEACVSFTAQVNKTTAGSNYSGYFEIVETANNAQTILQEGKSRVGLEHYQATAGQFVVGSAQRVCGTFTFATSGQKTLRLMYEQEVSSITSANVLADAAGARGQRDIHWEVRPIRY